MNKEWIASFFPMEMIKDQRSRVILGLLFDKIVCHFPIQGLMCGGGAGMFLEEYGEDTLVKAGVIELNEEIIHEKSYEYEETISDSLNDEEQFNKFIKFNVSAFTMDYCKNGFAVPVTDDPSWKIQAQLFEHFDVEHFAKLQASYLALQSFDLILPDIVNIPDEEILRARDKFEDQLIPFRNAMYRLAPAIRDYLKDCDDLNIVKYEAKYLCETTVIPTIDDLKKRISEENKNFWKKFLLKASLIIPKFVINWISNSSIQALGGAIKDTSELKLSLYDKDKLIKALFHSGGLGFLLSIEESLLKEK